MVKTKQDTLTLLLQNQQQIMQYGVRRLGIFGSFVRDQANLDSDVDFLVEFSENQETFSNWTKLGFYLEDLLGRPVDVLTTNGLSPFIGPRILREVEYVLES